MFPFSLSHHNIRPHHSFFVTTHDDSRTTSLFFFHLLSHSCWTVTHASSLATLNHGLDLDTSSNTNLWMVLPGSASKGDDGLIGHRSGQKEDRGWWRSGWWVVSTSFILSRWAQVLLCILKKNKKKEKSANHKIWLGLLGLSVSSRLLDWRFFATSGPKTWPIPI